MSRKDQPAQSQFSASAGASLAPWKRARCVSWTEISLPHESTCLPGPGDFGSDRRNHLHPKLKRSPVQPKLNPCHVAMPKKSAPQKWFLVGVHSNQRQHGYLSANQILVDLDWVPRCDVLAQATSVDGKRQKVNDPAMTNTRQELIRALPLQAGRYPKST